MDLLLQPWDDEPPRLPSEEARRKAGYWLIDGVRCCDLCTRGTSAIAREPVTLRLIVRPGLDKPEYPVASCAGCAGEAWSTGETIQDGQSPQGHVRLGKDPRFEGARERLLERYTGTKEPRS